MPDATVDRLDEQARLVARLERRVARETLARAEAERLLEGKSLEIFEINQRLLALNAELETRVAARTVELDRERRAAVELAERDMLTGLANRARFKLHLDAALQSCRDSGQELALLLIDLDHFKQVNDQRGHAAGDALLTEVASRLCRFARDTDLVARLGGDEFAVVMQCRSGAQAAGMQLAARLCEAMRHPCGLGDSYVLASLSVGIAAAPQHTTDAADLLRFADLALYEAKDRGRAGYASFTPELMAAFVDRHQLADDLREAIDARRITVWFQPIVDVQTGALVAAEALARWHHPSRGMVPPDRFIAIAEERGTIGALGDQVIAEACRLAAPWLHAGRIGRISVNISPLQLKDAGVVERVMAALAHNRLAPAQLLLEVTESVMLTGSETVLGTLAQLRAQGVKLALDDFGAGYSNLSYLTQLRFDMLKIDRGFVRELETDFATGAMIRSITALAHELGVAVVVEGVERAPQARLVASYGCDFAQGYLFSRPVPADAFLRLVDSCADGAGWPGLAATAG